MLDIHLCQPGGKKSCAACCGIYNYADNLKHSLLKRFAYRSQIFSKVRAGSLALDAYRDIVRHREDGKRIYRTIYTCEFVGFLNRAKTKVGCMLHPLQNQGRDLREKSFYGRDLCEGHFCPSYEKLCAHEARIVIDSIEDWYLYGAVITDIDYVKAFFKIVQDVLGEEVQPGRIKDNPRLQSFLEEYFGLKTAWPFRDTARPRFGKYYFVGEEYAIHRIDYATLDAGPSSYDPILLSLSSHFTTRQDLDVANSMLDVIIEGFIREYGRSDS